MHDSLTVLIITKCIMQKIAARVRYFKEEPKGVADMCKTMQVIVDRECDEAEVSRSKKIA